MRDDTRWPANPPRPDTPFPATTVPGTNPAGTVESPCISICTLDDAGVCVGCFRTVEEIETWSRLDVDRRRLVLRECERRRVAEGVI